MSNNNDEKCSYCHQLLPGEKKVIHTRYGKTCSWLCSNSLCNIMGLKENIIFLGERIDAIMHHLNRDLQRKCGYKNVSIDFDDYER